MAIPKDKQRKVTLVGIVTGGALVGLWFGLLSGQYAGLDELANRIDAAQHKQNTAVKALDGAKQLEAELRAEAEKLALVEAGMASGDLSAWVYNKVRQFKLPYRVEIPQFSSIVEGETTLLPKFPYRQVTMTIGGTGFFHDIGTFVADFENQFPHMRVEKLELEPAPSLAGAEKEKLSFRMNVVVLVTTGTSAKAGAS